MFGNLWLRGYNSFCEQLFFLKLQLNGPQIITIQKKRNHANKTTWSKNPEDHCLNLYR
jgi:hypothetical protein